MMIGAKHVLRIGSVWAPVAVGLWALGAQPAGAQTLTEALAGAYATNPTLSAARAELRAVNEGVPQALSNWRPDKSGSTPGSFRRRTFHRSASRSRATSSRWLSSEVSA